MKYWRKIVELWKNTSIKTKHSIGIGLLVFLMLIISSAGIFSLYLVQKADVTIRTNTRIQSLIFEIDREMEKARHLHAGFFLYYPKIGLQKAHEEYAQPSIRKAAKVVSTSHILRELISQPDVSDAFRKIKVGLNLYFSSAKRFADTSIESFELATILTSPDNGLEDSIDKEIQDLKTVTLQLNGLSDDIDDMEDLINQYRIKRKRYLMQSAFNISFNLLERINTAFNLDLNQKNTIISMIKRINGIADQILEIDVAIDSKFKDFVLQENAAHSVSEKFIALAKIEVTKAQKKISLTQHLTAGILIALTFFGLVTAGIIANILNSNITRRVIQLTHVTKKMREGQFDVLADEGSKDELGHLGKTFNYMATRMKILVDNLEQEVNDRTRELSEANNSLKTEIHERKQTEDELKKTSNELSDIKILMDAVFEQSPIPMAVAQTSDAVLLIVNPACQKNLGLKRDLVGKSLINTELEWKTFTRDGREIPPENLPLARAIRGETVLEEMMRVERKDGSSRWIEVSASPIFDKGGNQIAAQIAFPDITERQQAEEALKEKTKFLDHIIEYSALSMWISDEKGTAIRTNSACLEFFGATKKEFVGKYNLFKDVVIEKKGLMPVVRDIFKKGKPASFVIDYDFGEVDHVEVKNATHKIIKTVLTPVLDNNKKVSNVIVQTIDLTEIKKSEEEKIRVHKILAEHEKLSLVAQVAGKMAHDFNNILGIIMGNAELSLLDCKDVETQKTLKLIYEQTIRGKNLTKNLIAFAKDQEPKQEFFRISEKIDLVLNLMRKDMNEIELIKEDKPGVPELLADPGMIEHALVNLIQNSIHATSMVEFPKIIVRTYSLDNKHCFEIEDNGCGISKENLRSIYEPSFTLKGSKDVTGSYKSGIKGTGYGMSNVKKYFEQHKGTISIESELGSGTKFTISLPVIKKELTKEEKTEIRTGNAHFEKYILLVEDETAIADVQYRILTEEPCNHKVDIANNGKVAMDLFDRNQYDFVSLDYVLPGGLNGMDVYHHIRETNKNIPILFVSGNIEFLESIKELKQKDAYIDHLSKPCQNKDYVNGINELLEKTLNIS